VRIEHALVGSAGVIGVGGDVASLIDFDHTVYGDFPLMLALIAAATFILLTRAAGGDAGPCSRTVPVVTVPTAASPQRADSRRGHGVAGRASGPPCSAALPLFSAVIHASMRCHQS
jgi:hypothetical protein